MVLCDNVFCSGEVVEFEYVTLAGRRFCCVACAEAWSQQNEVLTEAGTPLRDSLKDEPHRRNSFSQRRNALT